MPALIVVALYFGAANLLLDASDHTVSYKIDETIENVLSALVYYLAALALFALFLLTFSKSRYQTLTNALRWLRKLSWGELLLLRIPLAYVIVSFISYTYVEFKINIPNFAPYTWDAFFAEADRWLFLGIDPWKLTHAILPGSDLTRLIDNFYLLWFLQMKLVTIAAACLPLRSHLRLTYLLAFGLSAAICGTFLAILLPAAGPVYVEPLTGNAMFKPLMDQLYEHAASNEIMALTVQERLWEGYVDPAVDPMGISAFPSIHVQYAALCAVLGFAVHRALGWALTLYAALMLLGSVHLGWHYAVDGIIGIALAIAIWRFSARVTRWWLQRTGAHPAAPTKEPALAAE